MADSEIADGQTQAFQLTFPSILHNNPYSLQSNTAELVSDRLLRATWMPLAKFTLRGEGRRAVR